jgi:S-methyl-1-thioxylulose 5-phosphate methylthiotransferase
MKDVSKVIVSRDFRWQGVDVREYKGEGDHFRDVSKQVLLGEADDETSLNFVTRYFEVQPGGYSSLERHQHPHAVVVVRGRGKVILGESVREIGRLDCVYVAPGDFHQFHALGDEPLGFLCVVDRKRDRPATATQDDVESLASDPAIAELLADRRKQS